jgi:hypothetical protein
MDNNFPIKGDEANRDGREHSNLSSGIKINPVHYRVVSTQKRQFHWLAYVLSLFFYFGAKSLAVSLNFPFDMYAVVILVAALAIYHNKAK